MKILLQILPYGKTREFRPRNQSQNYITHLPSTNEVKWISDKKDLNTSSFKHLFNALLMSLHSPRNFPTGCCKERRKKKLYTAQEHGQEGTHVFTTQDVNY